MLMHADAHFVLDDLSKDDFEKVADTQVTLARVLGFSFEEIFELGRIAAEDLSVVKGEDGKC